MKSNTVILILCWVSMIMHWTTDVFPGGLVPAAFCGSYLIMWLFGAFKNEDQFGLDAIKNGKIEDSLSPRQKDFIEKMQKGLDDDTYEPDPNCLANIKMIAEDGTQSSVIIMEDGEIKTDGDPNPEIVDAARMLRKSVLESGPEAIAQELSKQIANLEGENDDK